MEILKIKVRDITDEGMELSQTVPAKELGIEDQEDFKFIAPLEVKAKLEKTSNTVLAKTAVEYKYSSFCVRCLEPIEKEYNGRFLFDFPKKEFPEVIDLGEEVRQEIVLDIPVKLLCREDCKGLCIGCGVNLNVDQCQCKVKL